MCQDGTVFVGYTPDGHVKMFAMPCPGRWWKRVWLGWLFGKSVKEPITSGGLLPIIVMQAVIIMKHRRSG